MTTRVKNWTLRPYLDSGHWIEEESTILVTDTFCVLTSVMKPSCLGSSVVMRAGFMAMTETKQQSSQWKSPMSPRPQKWKAISRAWSSLSLMLRGLCTKNLSQWAKLWIPGSTAMFCGDWVKTWEDFAPNFSENRPGCFTMTMPHLTLPSSPCSFWWKTKWLSSPTHHTPLIWHPVTSSYFQKWNWSWKDAGLVPLRRYRLNRRDCLTLW